MTTTRTKRGICDYSKSNAKHSLARVLAAITAAPCMPSELRARLHMTERSVSRHVAYLRGAGQVPSERVVRIGKWNLERSVYHPVFMLGSAPDAKKPKQTAKQRYAKWRATVRKNPEIRERMRQREVMRWAEKKAKSRPNTWHGVPVDSKPSTFATPKSLARIALLLGLLEGQRLCVQQLADASGLSYCMTNRYLNHLHEEADRRVFVADWQRTKADYIRLFALGNQPDAPRPPKLSSWAKLKADPVRHAQFLRSRRIERHIAPPPPPVAQSWHAQLM